jgi:phosphoribosylamine--glycine ligase
VLKVLVVGNGAREHAITKKLAEGEDEIFAVMSRMNPGIAKLAKEVRIGDITNPEIYRDLSKIDIAFIGPEAPLAAGVADRLNDLGVPVVGPTKALARLEWSKAFTREFLESQGIRGNPDFRVCRTAEDVREFCRGHPEVAVKPDVLTGGKGVKISGEHLKTAHEVEEYALERIASDGLVVLEERLIGREFTLQAFSDGNRVEVMPLVRDFKRALDGDKGPNTGSMGSYSCPDHGLPDLSDSSVQEGVDIMKATVDSLSSSVGRFRGVLYGGFMETDRGVYLLEYNVRLGDPEAMNVLALLRKPLIQVGWEIVDGRLSKTYFERMATVCVYLVPKGYPTNPTENSEVRIGEIKDSQLFFASVHEEDGVIRTTGSRSIALLGLGKTVKEAREKVYNDTTNVEGELFYRKDIAANL